MRQFFAAILLAGFGMRGMAVPPPKPPLGPPTKEELAAGEALAEKLRSSAPTENSEFHGKLIIDANDVTRELPVICRVRVSDTNWQTDYEISGTTNTGAESLVVIHTPNGPNQYLYAHAASPGAPLPKPLLLSPDDAVIPLAGSDFSLADLGLDFLHWPVQRQLKGEMHLGQWCNVLESSNSLPREIVRVKSAIDSESNGLLLADAYDAKGKLIKEFSLHGSSFKKVNGHWQVEKMDIRNKKTGSHTELKFDLKE